MAFLSSNNILNTFLSFHTNNLKTLLKTALKHFTEQTKREELTSLLAVQIDRIIIKSIGGLIMKLDYNNKSTNGIFVERRTLMNNILRSLNNYNIQILIKQIFI